MKEEVEVSSERESKRWELSPEVGDILCDAFNAGFGAQLAILNIESGSTRSLQRLSVPPTSLGEYLREKKWKLPEKLSNEEKDCIAEFDRLLGNLCACVRALKEAANVPQKLSDTLLQEILRRGTVQDSIVRFKTAWGQFRVFHNSMRVEPR